MQDPTKEDTCDLPFKRYLKVSKEVLLGESHGVWLFDALRPAESASARTAQANTFSKAFETFQSTDIAACVAPIGIDICMHNHIKLLKRTRLAELCAEQCCIFYKISSRQKTDW